MKGGRDAIRQVLDDFTGKFLRMSVAEDDKLELDLGYQYSLSYLGGNSLAGSDVMRWRKKSTVLRIGCTLTEIPSTSILLCSFSQKWPTKAPSTSTSSTRFSFSQITPSITFIRYYEGDAGCTEGISEVKATRHHSVLKFPEAKIKKERGDVQQGENGSQV